MELGISDYTVMSEDWLRLKDLVARNNWLLKYLFSCAVPHIQKQRVRAAAAPARSLQSCPTLCDPIDGSPPGSAIPGPLQARTLEWVAISFSNA